MTQEEALLAAKGIMERHTKDVDFRVSIDNPRDLDRTVKAFKKLGCRVKTHGESPVIVVSMPKTD